MAETKAQLEARLMRDIDDLQATIDQAGKESFEKVNRISKLEKELEETQYKVSALKGVARFYRGQRDRIDAYLSGVLDTQERDQEQDRDRCVEGPMLSTTDFAPPEPTMAAPLYRQRPDVQEPTDPFRRSGDGRRFAPYRDAEPDKDWENY